MKIILPVLLISVVNFTAKSQDVLSKITSNASFVISINGAALFENISEAEVENSLLFKELSSEIFRGKAMVKPSQFSEMGVNMKDKFYFAMENTEDITYYLFTYKIDNLSAFEKFVKVGDATKDNFEVLNGLNVLSYSAESKLVWNNSYALYISSTYVGEEYRHGYYNSYYNYDYNEVIEEAIAVDMAYEVVETKCESGKCEIGDEAADLMYTKEEKEREEIYRAEQKRRKAEERKKEEKKKKEREEKRLKKENYMNKKMMDRITLFYSDNTENKLEINGFDEKAVASFWYDSMNFMDFSKSHRYGYYGLFRSRHWYGFGKYFSGDCFGDLFFEEDKVSFRSKMVYSDNLKDAVENIYSTKLNKKFIKYVPGDALGYASFSFSTKDVLTETENVIKNYFEQSDVKHGEEFGIYVDLISVIVDEEAIGDLMTGDAVFILNDLAYHEVTYKTYEYDENFNSTSVTKTKQELQPEFTMMMGSKNEELITKLFELAVKRKLVDSKNSYYIVKDKYNEFPFEIYFTHKNGILFVTNSSNQLANIVSGKSDVKLGSKHKKRLTKNSASTYLNVNLMVEKLLMDDNVSRDLRVLFEIKDDLKEIYSTSKLKNGNIETTFDLTIPQEEKSSAAYLLNVIDKVIDYNTKH